MMHSNTPFVNWAYTDWVQLKYRHYFLYDGVESFEDMSGVTHPSPSAKLCGAVWYVSPVRCWRTSRLLSLLFCRLSFLCWKVNILYLWTRSPLSSVFHQLRVFHRKRWHHERHVTESMHKPVISIVNQTYIQAQPQTKTPLAPAAPAQLWASR